MSQDAPRKRLDKEALKRLREERKEFIKAASARVKEQKKAVRAIKTALKESPRTVPEIAQATGMAPSEVMWYVATLKKYGEVLEAEQDGSYFRYRPAEAAADAH